MCIDTIEAENGLFCLRFWEKVAPDVHFFCIDPAGANLAEVWRYQNMREKQKFVYAPVPETPAAILFTTAMNFRT